MLHKFDISYNNFGLSHLKNIDPGNFNDNKIDGYYKLAETFVQDIYEEQHLVGWGDQTDKSDIEEDKDSAGMSNQDLLSKMNLDNNTRLLYERLLKATIGGNEKGNENNVKDQEAINKKKIEVKNTITNAVNEYIYYCKNKMNVLGDLRYYGSEYYKKNVLDDNRLKPPFRDGYYAYRYFDLLLWWELVGTKRWPCLGIAASIVLGKPSHNGFQERVFSRGTYFDDPLKQRMKEDNYEKSVLNSLNIKKINDLMELMPEVIVPEQKYEVARQQMELFFEREIQVKNIIGNGNVELDTDNDNDNDEDDEFSVHDELQERNELGGYDDLSILTSMEKEDDTFPIENEESVL